MTASALARLIPPFLAALMATDEEPRVVQTGIASWYGENYRGKKMANGERFDPDKLTCATWHWPLGAALAVEHGEKTVIVRVTDRGPALPLGRLIDLSQAAFARIAPLPLGLVRVKVWQVSQP